MDVLNAAGSLNTKGGVFTTETLVEELGINLDGGLFDNIIGVTVQNSKVFIPILNLSADVLNAVTNGLGFKKY